MKKTSLELLPWCEVSHNPAIKKQMMVGFDELLPVTQFSRAIFPPGESAPGHLHENMAEVFYVEKGCAVMNVDGRAHNLMPGDSMVIHPGETHELSNAGTEEMVVIYFGVNL